MRSNYKFGFIGYGKMGSAIISGAVESGGFSQGDFCVFTPSKESKQNVENDHSGIFMHNNAQNLVAHSDIIVLCAKPQMYEIVLTGVKKELKGKVLVSIAAGLTNERLSSILGDDASIRIIRTMPNIAAMVSSSCTILSSDHNLDKYELIAVKKLFLSVGTVFELPEKLLDPGSTIAGSGPAFVSVFIDAIVDAGVYLGIDRTTSKTLALDMIRGSVDYLSKTQLNPSELKDRVCSPAGSSIVGVKTLHDEKMHSAVMNAIINTSRRCSQISKEEKQVD